MPMSFIRQIQEAIFIDNLIIQCIGTEKESVETRKAVKQTVDVHDHCSSAWAPR
jgi:hypothetical protein